MKEEKVEEVEEIILDKKKKDNKVVVMPVLTKEKEAEIFKALAHKSYKEVGHDFGLHLFQPDDSKLSSFIFNISRRIKKAPEIWGLSRDLVEVIQEAMDNRSIKNNPKRRSDIALQEESFRDKLDTMRDTVAEIISKKLKKYNTTKGIHDISIRDLKDLLGMAIDKGRLLRGESTENLVKMSKIDTDNMSPDEALKVIMKARDALVEGKR